ncbi:hypothetical protein MMC25_003170 [Agyrium rufum]|nr:hypothetical protein [Agyrium rufum]
MQRLIKVDGKVRTDTTYPAGFMDVISIEKTGENFRLIYDTKGRFTVHRITTEEAEYKLGKVKKVQIGRGGIPYLVTHDARTIRYPDPAITVNDTVKIDLSTGKISDYITFDTGAIAMATGGRNMGRVGVITHRERHDGGFNIVHIKDAIDNSFATRESNVFVIGDSKPWLGVIIVVVVKKSFGSSLAYVVGQAEARSSILARNQGSQKSLQYAGPKELRIAVEELQQILGEDGISTDDDDLQNHGFSEWSTVNSDQLPIAVAYPKCTEDVSKIATICNKYRIPMTAYSGGSSLEANFSCPYGGISIDFTFMDQIITLHADDLDVVVQPGIQWMELNDQIKQSGLFFPVDPGPSAKIGGMVGTSCSGTGAVRWGTMKDWVINLTVVLADGTIIKTRKRPRKSSAGYNLTGMFVGSEGTLGIVTEATLKLAVIPQETNVGVVTFPTIRHAAAAASKVMRAGVPVAAMEILDDVQMNVINRAGQTGKTWKEVPTLFFKFSGTTAGVKDNITMVKAIAKEQGGGNFDFAPNAEAAEKLWSARKQALWAMLSLRESGYKVWSTDVAVPLSRLPDIIEISKREMDDLGLFASILGHVGDGNFHESIMYDGQNLEQKAAVEHCVHAMVDRALEMEGTCTGEHGIGLGKKESLVKELGEDTINVMRAIKGALDPKWLLNPGKIFEPTHQPPTASATKDEHGASASSGIQKWPKE